MVFVFALSIFASNFVPDTEYSRIPLGDGKVSVTCYLSTMDNFDSVEGEFGFFYISGGITPPILGLINAEKWHELLSKEVFTDSNSLIEAVRGLQDGSVLPLYVDSDCTFVNKLSVVPNRFYFTYTQYCEYLKKPTYNDGFIDGFDSYKDSDLYIDALNAEYSRGLTEGVAEYMESDEYHNTLSKEYQKGVNEYKGSEDYYLSINEMYAIGKLEGIEFYKTSSEYEGVMNIKYNTGVSDGVSNYLKSESYRNVLESEYKDGFEDGVTKTQSDNFTKTIVSAVGICTVSVLLIWLISKLNSRSKRAKRR